MANIRRKIIFTMQVEGQPIADFLKKLSGYDFFEIRQRKSRNIVIRVCYFRYENMIVLLNVFEKPAIYSGKQKNKEVERNLKVTDKYYNKFLKNPNSYEKYD